MRRFVVMGGGAVGLSLAAFLLRAGHDVVVVVRKLDQAARAVTVSDEIGGRELAIAEVDIRTLAQMPERADALFVCTRGESIGAAVSSLAGRLDANTPIVVPGVTFDDLDELARTHDLMNPMMRLAVGFGAWETQPAHLRVFPTSPFGSALAAESHAPRGSCRALARTLSDAGLPTRAPPSAPLRWCLRLFNALQIPLLLAWEKAGWKLDNLCRNPRLLAVCASAIQEVARIMRVEAGPAGWVVSLLPRWVFRRIAYRVSHSASERTRQLLAHHGPKLQEQLRFNAEQILAIAKRGGRCDAAFRSLVGRP